MRTATRLALVLIWSCTLLGVAGFGPAVLWAKTVGPPVVIDGFPSTYPHAFYGHGVWGVTWYPLENNYKARLKLYNKPMIVQADITDFDLGEEISSPAAEAGNNCILMTYCSGNDGMDTYRLVAVLYDSLGSQLDREFLTTHFDYPVWVPAIANREGTNQFMVLYQRLDESPPQPNYVWGMIVDTAGGQIVTTSSPAVCGDGNDLHDVKPAAVWGRYEVSHGIFQERYFVVWQSEDHVHGQSVSIAGSPAGGEISFPELGLGGGYFPSIARAPGTGETNIIVTWTYTAADGSPATGAQCIDVAGNFEGSAVTISAQSERSVVAASASKYLVVFRQPTTPGMNDRLLGRYLNFDGSFDGHIMNFVDDDAEYCQIPSVASDGEDFLIVYQTGLLTSVPLTQKIVACRLTDGVFTNIESDVTVSGVMNRGVAWANWTGSNSPYLPDLFIATTTGEQNYTFQNLGNNDFNERTTGASAGLSAQGAAFADYDNDGDMDLFVSTDTGGNELYRRILTTDYFEPVAALYGLNDTGNARSIAWGDYDNDGLLDLYVGNKSTANRLYRNTGAGFTEVGGALGVADAGNTEGVAFIDYDIDGDQDIYVGNAGSANRLYRNNGGTFTEVAGSLGVADAGSARSVSWADYDNDGDFDLYISKYNEPNSLYRHEGASHAFVDVAASLGVNDAARGESACWADFDLDGDMDLFLANYLGTDRLWRNDGGTFTEIAALVGLDDDGPSLGAAWADMDADGDPDLCVTAYDGTNRIYRNDFTGNNWLQVELEGVADNRSGVGACVTIYSGAPLLRRQMVGGGNGYLSQNDLTLIFGLDQHEYAGYVEVLWPDGTTDVLWNVAANQRIEIVQGSGQTAIADRPQAASELRVVGNRPNPFNPSTTIVFDLPARTRAEVSIYDVAGRIVTVLVDEVRASGRNEVVWDGRDSRGEPVSSGVYFVRLRATGRSDARAITLLK